MLTKLLPGFSSDATLDQIVQHVIDCGQAQALVDCSIRDNCGLVNVLEEQYGITLASHLDAFRSKAFRASKTGVSPR